MTIEESTKTGIGTDVEKVTVVSEADVIPTSKIWEGRPLSHEYAEQLPSRGLFYKDQEGRPLLSEDGRIVLRPLTTREENILFTQGSDSLEKVVRIIDNCIVTEGVNCKNLLVCDQYFILLSLRIHSFGGGYDVPMTCKYCGASSDVHIDLAADLSMKYLARDVEQPFWFTLPISQRRIGFRLLRFEDQFTIRRYARAMSMARKKARGTAVGSQDDDTKPSYRAAAAITHIDDKEVDFNTALQFYDTMLMADSIALSNAMDAVEPGIENEISKNCPKCGAETTFVLPMTVEFFRPSSL